MPNSKQIVYLSQAQYTELITNGSITVNGVTVNYNENDLYVTPQVEPVTDVRINGTSIRNNGIANIPMMDSTHYGLGKITTGLGIRIVNGALATDNAGIAIKGGTQLYEPIVPAKQHESVFYGLSKLAGVDLRTETVTLGTYPDSSKAAIQNMLGITDLLSTEETTTATAAHALNSTFMMGGKLHRATAAIAIGDAVVEGENCEVTNVQERLENSWTKDDFKFNSLYGIYLDNGYIKIKSAGFNYTKNGGSYGEPLTPNEQHYSAFYGLAKAAGADEKNSELPFGTYSDNAKTAIRSLIGAAAASDVTVSDVQVNGTSVLSNGVANVPVASDSVQGVIKTESTFGTGMSSGGHLLLQKATDTGIRQANSNYMPIVPSNQHISTFYGLAKAAGDITQALSSNTVGTYTESAKASIRTMLGAVSSNVVAVQDEMPTAADNKVWLPETEAEGIQVPTMEDMNTALAGKVSDVQIDGTSIVSSGIANIPYADTTNSGGIVRANNSFGIAYAGQGLLSIDCANETLIKAGSNAFHPIVPYFQHNSVFYGLAKAAGDTTQAASSNAVGTYTADASAAIRTMLGTVSSTDLALKADKTDTVLETTLSRGRKVNTTVGTASIAFGINVEASGSYSVALGMLSIASGNYSKAEGYVATASGNTAHAEGSRTTASGRNSHSEGTQTIASAEASHSEGTQTTAAGTGSHAEGYGTLANGCLLHVEGRYNQSATIYSTWTANTEYSVGDKVSHSDIGYICTTANSDAEWTPEHWQCIYHNSEKALIIGNGTSDNARSNAYVLDWNGNAHYAGNVYVSCNADSTGGTRLPHDVQVNGTSVVSNGVANIPVASQNDFGVVKGYGIRGIGVDSIGNIHIMPAGNTEIKQGSSTYAVITTTNSYAAAFYGLAKAAGDTTQSASSNAIGTYTAEAKSAVQQMLGIDLSSIASEVEIPLIETVSGTTPTITGQPNTRYVCGEVATISITPPAAGSIDVIFDSGSTPAVITVPNTVRWPAWFDASSLEADTTYEILITDGVYGSVMTWAN